LNKSTSRVISNNPNNNFSHQSLKDKILRRYTLQSHSLEEQIPSLQTILKPITSTTAFHKTKPIYILSIITSNSTTKMCHYQNAFYSCGHFYDKFTDKPCRRVKAGKRCQGFEEHEEALAALCQVCKDIAHEAGERVREIFAWILVVLTMSSNLHIGLEV
jgi:hypothetical protein